MKKNTAIFKIVMLSTAFVTLQAWDDIESTLIKNLATCHPTTLKSLIKPGEEIAAIQYLLGYQGFFHNAASIVNGQTFIHLLTDAYAEIQKPEYKYPRQEIIVFQRKIITLLQYAINLGIDINAQDSNGWRALDNAIADGSIEVIQLLIKAGADLHQLNINGKTCLQTAIIGDSDPKTIETLLRAGANVNAQDTTGWTALDTALQQNGQRHIYNPNLSYSQIQKLYSNNEKTIDLLLQYKAICYDGTLSLHVAIKNNCSTVTLQKLINHGAFINQINHAWQTPLVAAMMQRIEQICNPNNAVSNLETIRILLQNGANPYAKTTDGKTALQIINTILDIINKNWIMYRYDYERFWEQLVYVTQDTTRIYVDYKNSIHIYNELIALKNLLQQYTR